MNTSFRFSIFLFCLLITSYSYSQSVGLNYYNTGAGQNYTGTVAFDVGKSTIGLGLGWTVNPIIQPDGKGHIFYKKQFATEGLHHLNVNLFYHRSILPSLEHLDLFVFYDFQAKHSAAMNYFRSDRDVHFHGPYYWLENAIGLGFDVNIIGNLYMTQKFGGGAYFIVPSGLEADRINVGTSLSSVDFEFMYLLNFGLKYKFS